jgi:hypothetical protein
MNQMKIRLSIFFWLCAACCTVIHPFNVFAADTATYGSHMVQGNHAAIWIDSYEGALIESDLVPDPYYRFWLSDGVDFRFRVTDLGKTLDYAYLYHGDGTGQFVSPMTPYNKSYGHFADYAAALILVYTDSTSEEIECPLLVEVATNEEIAAEFGVTENSPGVYEYGEVVRPSGFVPPITTSTVVNSHLTDNGHATQQPSTFICICGIKPDSNGNIKCGRADMDGDSECKSGANCLPICP